MLNAQGQFAMFKKLFLAFSGRILKVELKIRSVRRGAGSAQARDDKNPPFAKLRFYVSLTCIFQLFTFWLSATSVRDLGNKFETLAISVIYSILTPCEYENITIEELSIKEK